MGLILQFAHQNAGYACVVLQLHLFWLKAMSVSVFCVVAIPFLQASVHWDAVAKGKTSQQRIPCSTGSKLKSNTPVFQKYANHVIFRMILLNMSLESVYPAIV